MRCFPLPLKDLILFDSLFAYWSRVYAPWSCLRSCWVVCDKHKHFYSSSIWFYFALHNGHRASKASTFQPEPADDDQAKHVHIHILLSDEEVRQLNEYVKQKLSQPTNSLPRLPRWPWHRSSTAQETESHLQAWGWAGKISFYNQLSPCQLWSGKNQAPSISATAQNLFHQEVHCHHLQQRA